jgi:hypothetical protein
MISSLCKKTTFFIYRVKKVYVDLFYSNQEHNWLIVTFKEYFQLKIILNKVYFSLKKNKLMQNVKMSVLSLILVII